MLHNPSVWTVEKELLCVCHIIIFVVEITLYGQFQADIIGISSMVCIIQVKALTSYKSLVFHIQVPRGKQRQAEPK